jgi:hypothetical protein
MKKRLLLMLIAVVCLSPSIVFAGLTENSYVGNSTTTFSKDPITGDLVSVKGSPQSLGSFNRMPAATIQAAPDVAAGADCPFAATRIRKNAILQQAVDQKLELGAPTKSGSAS